MVGGRRVATSRKPSKAAQQDVWVSYNPPQNKRQIKHNQFCQMYHQLKDAVSADELKAAEAAFRKDKDLRPIKKLQDSMRGGDPVIRESTKRLFRKCGAVSRAAVAALQSDTPAADTPTDLQSWLAFRAPSSKPVADGPISVEQALDRLKL